MARRTNAAVGRSPAAQAPSPARPPSRRRQIAFRVLAVVVPLLAIEAAARVYWSLFIYKIPEKTEMADDLMWHDDWRNGTVACHVFPENRRFMVGNTPTRTNNLGFRGDEWVEIEAGHTELRVLCIGDSVTFGYTVSGNDQTYPEVLQKWLQDKGLACQVINGGMPRYCVQHMIYLFEQKLPILRPDVVVVLGGWNDVNDHVLTGPEGRSAALVTLLKDYLYTVRVANHWREAYLRSVAPNERVPAKIDPQGVEGYRESLIRLIGLCRQSGAKPVLCTLPSFFAHVDTEASRQKASQFAPMGTFAQLAEVTRRMNESIRAVGASERVPVCPLEAIDAPSLFSDAIHPNDEGSAAIAARVGQFLIENRLTQPQKATAKPGATGSSPK